MLEHQWWLLSRSSEEGSWGIGRVFGVAFLPSLLRISFKFFSARGGTESFLWRAWARGFFAGILSVKILGLDWKSNSLSCHQEIPEMYAQHQSEERGMFSQDKRENPRGHDPCLHVTEEMRLFLMAPEGGAGLRPESRSLDKLTVTMM